MTDDDLPSWVCPSCGQPFHAATYDIGSGPEVACPHCEMCFGANGQQLKPLDIDKVQQLVDQVRASRERRRGRHRA